MDYSNAFKYFVFRLGLLLGTDLLALLFGKIMLWVISSVIPTTADGVKMFLIDERTGSLVAFLTMIITLGLVFRDDGKKHAAYEDMDMSLVLVSVILLLMFYFVPVIFYNPSDITRMWESVYYAYYFPCRWIMVMLGADIKTAAAAGMGIILAVQFFVYYRSYSGYRKKHPFIFRQTENTENTEDAEA